MRDMFTLIFTTHTWLRFAPNDGDPINVVSFILQSDDELLFLRTDMNIASIFLNRACRRKMGQLD
jgi:hypothetical protein